MTSGALQALIFDVDGTLADTESVHLAAFNQAFAELGMDWVWTRDMYLDLLTISGGKERILHYWNQVNADVVALGTQALQDRINRIHELKTAFYENAVNSGAVALRPGVLALLHEALAAGVQLAIATTTSPVMSSMISGVSGRFRRTGVCIALTQLLLKPVGPMLRTSMTYSTPLSVPSMNTDFWLSFRRLISHTSSESSGRHLTSEN